MTSFAGCLFRNCRCLKKKFKAAVMTDEERFIYYKQREAYKEKRREFSEELVRYFENYKTKNP